MIHFFPSSIPLIRSLSLKWVCRPGSLLAIFSSSLWRPLVLLSLGYFTLSQKHIYVPSRQFWHSRCVLFGAPQPEHLQRLLTSLRALPAICLCRFRECETLFFGTALRTDSQMSSSNVGSFRLTPGIASERIGRNRPSLRDRAVQLGIGLTAREDNRGSRAVDTEAILKFPAAVVVFKTECDSGPT